MIFNIGVSVISLALLVYWFRYTCLLLLRTKPVRDYSKQVVAANQLAIRVLYVYLVKLVLL